MTSPSVPGVEATRHQKVATPGQSPSEKETRILVAEAVRRSRQRRWTVLGSRTALAVVVLILWELTSGRTIPELFISEPTKIAERLASWTVDGTLLRHTVVTLQEALGGFVIGTVLGVVAGVVLARLRMLGDILNPFLVALYGTPKLALVPLLILWFGIAMSMKIALAAIIVFFLVFYNTHQGVQAVPQSLLNVLRVMGGNPTQLLIKVILPSAALWVFTGLRISIPYALSGAVVGEIMASNIGLGYLLQSSAAQLDSAGMFAALIVIMVLAFLLHVAVETAQRFVTGTDDAQAPIV